MDMLRSISKQSGESAESVLKKKREGYGGKDLQKKEGFVGFYVGHKPQSAQTRLNQSRCCLGCGLGWDQWAMHEVGAASARKAAIWGEWDMFRAISWRSIANIRRESKLFARWQQRCGRSLSAPLAWLGTRWAHGQVESSPPFPCPQQIWIFVRMVLYKLILPCWLFVYVYISGD